jgi:sporulation integral membrane protein YtvI
MIKKMIMPDQKGRCSAAPDDRPVPTARRQPAAGRTALSPDGFSNGASCDIVESPGWSCGSSTNHPECSETDGGTMLDFYKKYYKTAFDIGLIIFTAFLIMWIFSFLYRIAAPIFLAFLVFAVIEPLASFLHKRGLNKAIATALSVLLFVTVLLSVIAAAGAVFVVQIGSLVERLDDYAVRVGETISGNLQDWQRRIDALPDDLVQRAMEFSGAVAEKGAQIAQWFLRWLLSFVSSMSSFFVNFVIGIILAYFLSLEIGSWKRIAREKTPNTFKQAYFFLRDHVLKGLVTYLKAQLKLVALTFAIIYVALLILRVDNAFSVAVLAAVFDLLPLLGVATVFVPWIIYLFVVGNTTLAIWLIVLLGFVILVRQILEPKITGESLGVSAFTMLSFMVVSTSLFGVAGLILSPVLIILIKALYDQGYLQKWIRKPEDY